MSRGRLPLGVDLGVARIRVAALSRVRNGSIRLDAVATADVTESQSTALSSAVAQLGSDERRCVAMMRAPEARLRSLQLPPMSGRETEQAIGFEGLALFGDEENARGERIIVRSIKTRRDDGGTRALIAASPMARIRQTLAVVVSAGLRPACIDHEACALTRLGQLPLLDIGFTRSTLVMLADDMPLAAAIPLGGDSFTRALAADLGADYVTAEARKRTIGLGGAAKFALDTFVRELAERFRTFRENHMLRSDVLHVCGNGSRLEELRERIALEIGVNVVPVALGERVITTLPFEVERSGALDWFSAIAAAFPSPKESFSCTA